MTEQEQRDRSPQGDRGPRIAVGLALATIVLTLAWTGDLLFASYGLRGALAGELLLVLLPTLVYARGAGLPLGATFRLRRSPWRGVLAALLLAPAAGVLLTALFRVEVALWPLPAGSVAALERLADEAAAMPTLAFLALAAVPAVAEEALFRGLALTVLEARHGAAQAVALQALLFGAFHRSPHRFVPMLLLGLALGALARASGSLLPPILLHLVYNFLILGAPTLLDQNSARPLGLGAACALVATATIVMARIPALPRGEPPAQGSAKVVAE